MENSIIISFREVIVFLGKEIVMEGFIILLVFFIYGVAWIVEQIKNVRGNKNRGTKYYSQHSIYNPQSSYQNQKKIPQWVYKTGVL